MSIYRSYPVALYQQQQPQLIDYDIQQLYYKPEQSRLLDALFSLESVPFPNPLIFLSQPSPLYQHSANIPTQNFRRFPFQMPAFPSFEQSFNMFPQGGAFPSFPQQNFPNMDDFFKEQFDSKRFMPAAVQESMTDEVRKIIKKPVCKTHKIYYFRTAIPHK